MKKSVKKFAAVGMTVATMVNLAACGNSGSTTNGSSTGDVTKPDMFTVMVNNTVVTESNGGKEFYAYLQSLTDLNINWVRPDHSGYYDAVSNAFNSENNMPDVVLLSSDYYSLYASNGFLWDMTDAWNNSDLKKSGRLVDGYEGTFDNLLVRGEDGKKAMYGFSSYRGDGCVTYVKAAWLEAAGIPLSDVENVTMDFETYYGYLKKMSEAKGHYAVSVPGFIQLSEPYTNYLPEFYQDANFTFYQNASGEYVDGFSEVAMQNALKRIATGIADGVIDRETVNNSTANARDKFYSKDANSESGVFTYWSGTWANTLKTNLATKGLDDRLIAIKPIKELGAYTQRIPATWCITTTAKNPEGIFKYFLESMLDGGEVQTAWEYGAKGTHWDTVAETVTLQGKEDQGVTYEEGTFHMLPQPENPSNLMAKNNMDPMLALAKFKDVDPGIETISKVARDNSEFFFQNCKPASILPMTSELSDYINDINTARSYIITQVAMGSMSVEDGMKYYDTTVGSFIQDVLKSLNELESK